ncbi:hypothetical protein ACLB2K_017474 [Fragaria x ananassa]
MKKQINTTWKGFTLLKVDAPNLRFLSVDGDFEEVILKNTANLVDVTICLYFDDEGPKVNSWLDHNWSDQFSQPRLVHIVDFSGVKTVFDLLLARQDRRRRRQERETRLGRSHPSLLPQPEPPCRLPSPAQPALRHVEVQRVILMGNKILNKLKSDPGFPAN